MIFAVTNSNNTYMFRCWRVLSSVVGMQHWTNLDFILNYVGVVFGKVSLNYDFFHWCHGSFEFFHIPTLAFGCVAIAGQFEHLSTHVFGEIFLGFCDGDQLCPVRIHPLGMSLPQHRSIHHIDWGNQLDLLPRTPLALAHHTSLIIWVDTVLPVHGVLAQLMFPCTGFEFCSIIVHTLTWYYRLMRNNIPPIFWYCAENMFS